MKILDRIADALTLAADALTLAAGAWALWLTITLPVAM